MKKILIQFLICLMIWTVVEAHFVQVGNVRRIYIIQNTTKELKYLDGQNLDGNSAGNMKVILIVGDKVEEYKTKVGFWEDTHYRKLDYKRRTDE